MATQVRISDASHRALRELAKLLGDSMQGVLDKAVEAYRRRTFLDQVNREYGALKDDDKAWEDTVDERKEWESTLADGLDK